MTGVRWAGSEKYIQTLSENLMGRVSLRALEYIEDNNKMCLKEMRFGNMECSHAPQHEDQLQNFVSTNTKLQSYTV
jgi:hypothetical protein